MAVENLLEVKGVSQVFGGLRALDHLDLSIEKGKIVSLIGPNGAGKTTLFNVLTGVYAGTEGSILLKGEEIRGLKPHQIIARGMARTFQNIRLFANMTALENVMVARHCRTQGELIGALLRTTGFHSEERAIEESAKEQLAFVGLLPAANTIAKNLSYGDQRRLEIARALATDPDLLISTSRTRA